MIHQKTINERMKGSISETLRGFTRLIVLKYQYPIMIVGIKPGIPLLKCPPPSGKYG